MWYSNNDIVLNGKSAVDDFLSGRHSMSSLCISVKLKARTGKILNIFHWLNFFRMLS